MLKWLMRRLNPRRWWHASTLAAAFDEPYEAYLKAFSLAESAFLAGQVAPFQKAAAMCRQISPFPEALALHGGYLLDILEAHLLRRTNPEDPMVLSNVEDIYLRSVHQLSDRLESNRLLKSTDRDFLGEALSYARLNLASVRALRRALPITITEQLQWAIELQPDSELAWTQKAEYHVGSEEWEDAKECYSAASHFGVWRSDRPSFIGNTFLVQYQELECARKGATHRDAVIRHAMTFCESVTAAIREEGPFSQRRPTPGLEPKSLIKDLHAWKGKGLYTLGDLLKDANRLDEALVAYEGSATSYREADYPASEKVVRDVEGDLLLRMGRYSEALEKYRSAQDMNLEEPEDHAIRTQRQAKIALLNLGIAAASDRESAFARYISLHRSIPGNWDPYGRLVSLLEPVLSEQWGLRSALESHIEEERLKYSHASDALRDCALALRELHALSARGLVDSSQELLSPLSAPLRVNAFVPLYLDIHSTLESEMPRINRALEVFAPSLRNTIRDQYGVHLPGLRLRAVNEGVGPEEVRVLVNEVEVLRFSLSTGSAFIEAPTTPVKDSSLPSSATPKPSWARQGRWVQHLPSSALSAAGAEGPLAQVFFVAEYFLNLVLDRFVGHQEVQALNERHRVVSDQHDDIIAKETHGVMDRLSVFLKALTLERVPLANYPSVFKTFDEGRRRRATVPEMVRLYRLDPAVRPTLWGNNREFTHYMLGQRLCRELETGLRHEGARLVLPLERAELILGLIRAALAREKHPALICPKTSLRALVRKLIEPELRFVPVLALRELQPELVSSLEQEIELPDQITRPSRNES